MWQHSGSDNLNYGDFNRYIETLNAKKFAGFNDWRLPTLEEAMSLMEPEKKEHLYIDPIFDSKQSHIWTANQVGDAISQQWAVDFSSGYCINYGPRSNGYVRAVRTIQPSDEF